MQISMVLLMIIQQVRCVALYSLSMEVPSIPSPNYSLIELMLNTSKSATGEGA